MRVLATLGKHILRDKRNNADTFYREFVLKRDGTNVVTNDACASTSGTWKSPYDGATWTQASDIDIDHMVPLKNAWIVSSKETALFQSDTNALQSGAASWTTAQRTQFANDVTRPQLWAGKSSLHPSCIETQLF